MSQAKPDINGTLLWERNKKPAMVVKTEQPPRLWSPDETEVAEEERPRIIGPDGEEMTIGPFLVLGIEKFREPGEKWFGLIWIDRVAGEAWLCQEDKTRYAVKWTKPARNGKREKPGAFEAGQRLAEELGARFSDLTR